MKINCGQKGRNWGSARLLKGGSVLNRGYQIEKGISLYELT